MGVFAMHAQTNGWMWIKLCMQGPYHPSRTSYRAVPIGIILLASTRI